MESRVFPDILRSGQENANKANSNRKYVMVIKEGYRRFIFAGFLLLLFLLHFLVTFWIAKTNIDFFLHNDGDEYLAGVTSFLEKGSVMTGPERYYEAPRSSDIPEIWRGILLPFLTGLFAFLFRDPLIAASIFQSLVYVLLAVAVLQTGRSLGGDKVGCIAMLIFLIHPFFTLFSIRFSSENLFVFFLALFAFSFLGMSGKKRIIFMGVTAALAGAVRGTALLFLPAFAVFLLLEKVFASFDPVFPRKELRKILGEFALFALVFLLTISPFCIRNYIHFGIWNPAGCLGGFNLYVGNNLNNQLAYKAKDGKSFLSHQKNGWENALALAKKLPPGLSPLEQDRWFRNTAWQEIRKMGWKNYFLMTLGKAWHFIRPWPLHGGHSPLLFWVIALWESLLLLGGVAGIVLLWKKRDLLLFFLMVLCVGWLPHTLFHLQMRHRIPFLDLPMIFLAAYAFAMFCKKLGKNKNLEPLCQ